MCAWNRTEKCAEKSVREDTWEHLRVILSVQYKMNVKYLREQVHLFQTFGDEFMDEVIRKWNNLTINCVTCY